MEVITNFVLCHAGHAHWYLFIAIILAGFNIPISADVLILISAFLAAVVVPDNLWPLLLSVWIGCYLSAWCSYAMGRFLGERLLKYRFFNKMFPAERLSRIKKFYEKYGFLTLVIGRFIPFGVRNCLFMTSGMSKVKFLRFIAMDAVACSIWVLVAFALFYHLSHSYLLVWHYLKAFNLIIFSAFGVTLIGYLWYKRKKSQVKPQSMLP